MEWLLAIVLRPYIRRGNFSLTTSGGRTFTLGDGTGKPVAVRFTSRAAEWGLLLDPELKFGEAYMDGTLVVEEGTIADILALALSQNTDDGGRWSRILWLLRYIWRRWQQLNVRQRA
ncbi:MAG: cyclopropane-fatty-acyl-phospholipid synthase, partial [Alphaproteobacteria bacterium]|nr:cyclopropane-fatty-acyl-phospholipid synthase [Alphaproteobacteria bacterium]